MMCMSATGMATSVGGGVTSSGMTVVGGSTTVSTNQLAAGFNPGPKPSWVSGVVLGLALVLVGMMAIGDNLAIGVILAIAGAIIAFGMYNAKRLAIRTWDSKVYMYHRGWICLQCGHSWVPENS